MIYSLPKHFNHNYINKFLNQFDRFLINSNQKTKDFKMDCTAMNKVSVVGMLLIYKFMEFTVNNKCFNNPEFQSDAGFDKFILKYGFEDLIDGIVKGEISAKSKNRIFSNLDVKSGDNFIIAPYPMNRGKIMPYEEFQTRYIEKITKYYHRSLATEMIFPCISEILLNFWEHAIKDNQSILVAEGNLNKIEIACADTGDGIIQTMKEGRPGLTNGKTNLEILQLALERDITSKPNSSHMGRGLWILNEFAKRTGGQFNIYTQGVGIETKNGKTSYFKSGYWPGCLVYINLPLNNIVTMSEVLQEEIEKISSISLNLI